MDDPDDASYDTDRSDIASTQQSQFEPQPSPPHTPEQNTGPGSVEPDPPSTLRRSTRPSLPVQRLDPSVDERPAPSQVPQGSSSTRPATNNHTAQDLLKLPGFSFKSDKNVFRRDNGRFATLLGAQFPRDSLDKSRRMVRARDQRIVCLRVADVLEVCCDEWLEWWQDGPLTSKFWPQVAERLRCHKRHWANVDPVATGRDVYMICLTYTRQWDKNGRGDAIEDEASWGFELGELTWGNTKAEIDPDIFAKPWEYERASLADGPTCTENAARDFLEHIRDSEVHFGPIEPAERVRGADRNRSASRSGNTRTLVAPDEAPRDSGQRAVSTSDETHEFILGGGGGVIIVPGPRHRNNNQGEGSLSGRVKATVEKSDPDRLLVTFSGFV